MTNHNSRSGWTAYVITNLRHIQPKPPAGFMNGTSKGHNVVWESFKGDSPGAAVGVGLRKLGELLEKVALPVDAETYRDFEFKIELEVGDACKCCGAPNTSSDLIDPTVSL